MHVYGFPVTCTDCACVSGENGGEAGVLVPDSGGAAPQSAALVWPNPAGLDLHVGKAGVRVVLGFGDVHDLAEPPVAAAKIDELSATSSCPAGLCVIALRERDLDLFAKAVPGLKVDFALISLSTLNMPSSKGNYWTVKSYNTIYNSEHLKAWYTQNYDNTVPGGKMRVFPLGIDYHTLAGTSAQISGVGGDNTFKTVHSITPAEQDRKVKEIFANSAPWAQRPHTLYIGAYANTHATRQSSAFRAIRSKVAGVLHSPDRKDRWEMIRDLSKSKFVLAPRGLGMSSIRFYEAVMVGAVPVCDRLNSAPMNKLHERLGAIIVDSWAEVTDANIAKWTKAIETKDYASNPFTAHLGKVDRALLTTRFWMDCVRTGKDCIGEVY